MRRMNKGMLAEPTKAIALCLSACAALQGFPQLPPINAKPEPTSDYRISPRASDPEQTVFALRFPSAIVTSVPENNTAIVEIYEPRDARRPMPVVILLHYWGATDLDVERRFAKDLNARGMAAAVVTLPYHLQRTPPGQKSGEYAIRPDVAFLKEAITQAVFDIKRLLDWIESRPQQYDVSRTALAGISLGAVVGSLTVGVDDRISAAAFLLGGADLAHLLWHSSVTIHTRNALRGLGYTEQRLRQELESVEPMRFARPQIGHSILVIGARFDEVVPTEDTEKLIRAFEAQHVLWLDSGHYGGALVERRIYRTVAEFFQAKLTTGVFSLPNSVQVPTIRVGIHYNTDYKLTVAVGLDLWKAPQNKGFVSGMITPEGPLLFGGVTPSRGLTVGVAVTANKVSWGVFWGLVL